jgi:hypothetical protein
MTKLYLANDADRFDSTPAWNSDGRSVNPLPLVRRLDRFVVSPAINRGAKQRSTDMAWARRRWDAEQREAR